MENDVYDVIILGTGPAGLQAAIHAARTKISVLVLGRQHKSSLFRYHIENYCCLGRADGESMLKEGKKQAEKFGAFFLDEDVVGVTKKNSWFMVRSESGQDWKCRALILAMGISRNKLKVPGESQLSGHGVSYCVDCDANFFRGEPVAVIGCESAAVTGALTLLFYAREVYLICEKLDVTEILSRQIRESAIHILEGRQVQEILGKTEVEGLRLDDESKLEVTGVFIELGAKGAIEMASSLSIALDSDFMQFIDTNKKQETNVPGVYAAGDICGPPWQVAKAVGEGCVAGLEATSYAKKLR